VFKRIDVLPVAERLVEALRPACVQIEIAGSVRRGKPEVGDLEIVAQPVLSVAADMFGNPTGAPLPIALSNALAHLVHGKALRVGDRWGPRYKKGWVPVPGYRPDLQLDLFIVLPPAQFGPQLVIRTGPAEFSKRFVTLRKYGGLMPSNLKERDGCIWDGDVALDTPTEASVFAALGLAWVEPGDRR
jgi:DNA polymerase/3'-5' exonuclease PolX